MPLRWRSPVYNPADCVLAPLQAKRQVEVHKQAALCAESLRRFCAAQGVALPAAETAALRSAVVAAKSGDPLPPPKLVGHLDRLLAGIGGAAAGSKRASSAPAAAAEPPRKTKRAA